MEGFSLVLKPPVRDSAGDGRWAGRSPHGIGVNRLVQRPNGIGAAKRSVGQTSCYTAPSKAPMDGSGTAAARSMQSAWKGASNLEVKRLRNSGIAQLEADSRSRHCYKDSFSQGQSSSNARIETSGRNAGTTIIHRSPNFGTGRPGPLSTVSVNIMLARGLPGNSSLKDSGGNGRPGVAFKSTVDRPSYSARDRALVPRSTFDVNARNNADGRTFRQKRVRGTRVTPDEDDDDDDETEIPQFEGYSRSKDPQRDYNFGRVIETLLVAPSGSSAMSHTTPTVRGPEGSNLMKRRFVIIRAATLQSSTFTGLPIKTYNGRGVAARGVVKAHHTVIYTGRTPPLPTAEELPRRASGGQIEPAMQSQPIEVKTRERGTALDSMSRLDFFAYQDFDVKIGDVKIFGKVVDGSLGALYYQHQAVQAAVRLATGSPRNSTMSLADLGAWLSSIRERAQHQNLPQPRQLTLEEQQRLASSQEIRVQYLRRLQAAWRNIVAGRQQPQSISSEDDDEEEDGSDGS